MSAPTPGPWHAEQTDGGLWFVSAGDQNIVNASPSEPLSEADARLIAQTPRLLAALRDLVARCDGEEGVRADGSNIQTMYAHAVLAEIEGRNQ